MHSTTYFQNQSRAEGWLEGVIEVMDTTLVSPLLGLTILNRFLRA